MTCKDLSEGNLGKSREVSVRGLFFGLVFCQIGIEFILALYYPWEVIEIGPLVGWALVILGTIVVGASCSGQWIPSRLSYIFLVLAALTGINYCLISVEAARELNFPWLGKAFALLLQSCGWVAHWSNGQVLVKRVDGLHSFSTGSHFLSFRGVVAIFILTMAGLGDNARGKAKVILLGLVAISFGWLIKAAFFLEENGRLGTSNHPSIAYFLHPIAVGLPIALFGLLGALVITKSQRESAPNYGAKRMLGTIVAWVGIGIVLFLSPPEVDGRGRVVIDERHGGIWAPSGRVLNEQRYGDFATYSLSAMVEDLGYRFSVSVNRNTEYSPEFLNGIDVLLFCAPQKPISGPEVAAILQWVRDGGGLFLVGDHTDLLGMNTFLNELSEEAGIKFLNDSVSEFPHGGFNVWKGGFEPLPGFRQNIEALELMTPCSLSLGKTALPLMTAFRAGSTAGDYSRSSNFGGLAPRPNTRQGLITLGATASLGDGKVLCFTDSTIFSSFSYFWRGHRELALNSVAWLNQKPYFPNFLFRGFKWAVLLAVVAILLLKMGRAAGSVPLFGVLIGISAGVGLSAKGFEDVPEIPGRERESIAFFWGRGIINPPVVGSGPAPEGTKNFSTFSLIPVRMGYEVRESSDKLRVLDVDEILCLVEPESLEVLDTLKFESGDSWESWVKAGGRIILLHDEGAHGGCRHLESLVPSGNVEEFTLLGKKAFRATLGSGLIVDILGSDVFSNSELGHCMAWPSSLQMDKFKGGYQLFSEVIGKEAIDRRTYGFD